MSTFGTDSRCLPTGKTGCASLSTRPLTVLCPTQLPDPSPGCNLFQSFLPVMPAPGQVGLPWVWVESLLGAGKISLVWGLQPGGLGRDQGKVGEAAIRTVWLPENFTPLLGYRHGDEGRIIPGRQPTFVCMDGACPILPFFSLAPRQLKSESPGPAEWHGG